jgi:hypothetical protein
MEMSTNIISAKKDTLKSPNIRSQKLSKQQRKLPRRTLRHLLKLKQSLLQVCKGKECLRKLRRRSRRSKRKRFLPSLMN